MTWKVGQRVVCERPNHHLNDCVVRAIEGDSVIIFCRKINTVICGQQKNLEKLGWRVEEYQSSEVR